MIAVTLAALLAGPVAAETLLYGFDDAAFDSWYMRANVGSTPPEHPPVLGTDAPAQGEGYVSMGVESNNNYTLIRTFEGFQHTVDWELYDAIAVDVRASDPQGWNSFALVCRSDLMWNFTLGARQILTSSSGTWVTLTAPITPALTNYLYNAIWVYFEFTFNQATDHYTRVEIDNFRLVRESDQLEEGLPVYAFDTPDLDGWASYRRGVATWCETNRVLGAGAMQIDVTNAVGNWANTAQKGSALADAPWALNSSLTVWIAAGPEWSNNFSPQLLMAVPGTNYRIYASENSGHVILDNKWHPYTYAYNPAWIASASSLSLTWDVTCVGSPSGKTFFVDNMRLRPGNAPDPETNYLHKGLLVYGFETNTLDDWSGTSRAAAAWDTNWPALGIGAMRLEVTNALGNWANAANRWGAQDDAMWNLNSNIVIWLRADSNEWITTLRPELSVTMPVTNFTIAPEGDGLAKLDGAWHPYIYTYDPMLFEGASQLNFSINVATAGGDSPLGRTVYVDNIRLLPGIIPEPSLLAVCGMLGLLVRRRT